MKVRSKEEMILSMITRVMHNPDKIFAELGLNEDPRITCDHKCQTLRSNFVIPKEFIKDEFKNSAIVMGNSAHMLTAGINTKYASKSLLVEDERQKEWYKRLAIAKPKIADALNELMNAVEEDLKKVAAEEELKRIEDLKKSEEFK